MTSALPSRSTRSASVRSCFSNGIVASSSSTTTSAKRTARSASATASFSSFSTTRERRRRPAVSNNLRRRPRHTVSSADAVARQAGLRPGQQPVLAEDAVEQRRLAGVRPPEHGDAQRLRRVDFAAVLLLAEDERRRLLLFVRVEARGGRQRGGERVVEIAEALAMLGGKRDRIAEAEAEGLIGAVAPGRALRLVGDEDDRLAGAAHELRRNAGRSASPRRAHR